MAYYTVQSTDSEPAIDSLRGWLLGQLPAYMVPVAYVRLDALPLTPTASSTARPCRPRTAAR
ncbi:hypothetical protein QNM99_26470 [Pseudomonas sp. PCH446]